MGLRLIELMADDPRLMDELLIYKDVPARLADLILRLVDKEEVVSDEGYVIPSRYTHAQMGYMIGARRLAVTRAFGRLQDEGAVQLRRHMIYVRDTADLEHAAAREK